MHWDDTGYLLSKNRYSENSLISEIFTKNHGKVSGIIFGGTSKKIKNYLQIGNSIHVNYNSKSENRIGFFKVEILNALSPLYFDNYKKLSCITSAMHLIKILTADSQTNMEIYRLIEKFYELLKQKNWIKDYIFWELELLKNIGYDLELDKLVEKKVVGAETCYITKSSLEKKIVPNFMIEKSSSEHDLKILLSGLKLVGDYLEKTILKPNNINHSISRLNFINTLK
jgi:DNA repair protein RecO (recombination protein O)